MNKKILFLAYDSLQQDQLFQSSHIDGLGDDFLRPWTELKKAAEKQSILLETINDSNFDSGDAYVFIEMPNPSNIYFRFAVTSGKPLYLVAMESPLYRPQSFARTNHRFFSKIFTFHDGFVDNIRYLKLNYTLSSLDAISENKRVNFCAMIAGNKRAKGLYWERVKTIRWFERFHPDQFDLYGKHWNSESLTNQSWVKKLSGIPYLNQVLPYFPSYRGSVDKKHSVLSRYQYSICYENVSDIPGYITEKLLDCFQAGCIPIYWGAHNVDQYIPPECYIDRRKYRSHEDLYAYLSSISTKEQDAYRRNIAQFLKSEQAKPFYISTFVDTMLKHLK